MVRDRSTRLIICATLLVTSLVSLGQPAPRQATAASTASQRAASMSPGINLPWDFWFAGPPWDEVGGRYSAEDLARFRADGIRGVRIPTDYYLMAAGPSSPSLNAARIAQLDARIRACLDAGLNVIVDLHNAPRDDDGQDISDRLQTDIAFRTTFAGFWRRYARHLARFDPDRVMLEALNEPIFNDSPEAGSIWAVDIAPALVAAIRTGAPDHTILIGGPSWTNPRDISIMRPDLIPDPNVVYNLHYYDPFTFTHQGATWVGDPFQDLRSVPYPSSPAATEAVMDRQVSQGARDVLAQHGTERWDAAKVRAGLAVGIDWAERQGVPVMLTEFGVLRHYSDQVARARLLQDVRRYAEERGVPWMIWSDFLGFGYEDENGARDEMEMIALGLLPGVVGTPRIAITPGTISPGDRVTVSATGMPALTNVEFVLGRTVVIGAGRTDVDGAATVRLRFPSATTGRHTVVVREPGGGIAASTRITIMPLVRVSPTSGDTGDAVRIRLYGFGSREVVSLSLAQPAGRLRLIRVEVDRTGTLGATVIIPSSARLGDGEIVAVGRNGARAGTPFTVDGVGGDAVDETTASPTRTASPTAVVTLTGTVTSTATASVDASTVTPSAEPATVTATPTVTKTTSPTETTIPTETPLPTETPVPTETSSPSPTPSPEPSNTVEATQTAEAA